MDPATFFGDLTTDEKGSPAGLMAKLFFVLAWIALPFLSLSVYHYQVTPLTIFDWKNANIALFFPAFGIMAIFTLVIVTLQASLISFFIAAFLHIGSFMFLRNERITRSDLSNAHLRDSFTLFTHMLFIALIIYIIFGDHSVIGLKLFDKPSNLMLFFADQKNWIIWLSIILPSSAISIFFNSKFTKQNNMKENNGGLLIESHDMEQTNFSKKEKK